MECNMCNMMDDGWSQAYCGHIISISWSYLWHILSIYYILMDITFAHLRHLRAYSGHYLAFLGNILSISYAYLGNVLSIDSHKLGISHAYLKTVLDKSLLYFRHISEYLEIVLSIF